MTVRIVWDGEHDHRTPGDRIGEAIRESARVEANKLEMLLVDLAFELAAALVAMDRRWAADVARDLAEAKRRRDYMRDVAVGHAKPSLDRWRCSHERREPHGPSGKDYCLDCHAYVHPRDPGAAS